MKNVMLLITIVLGVLFSTGCEELSGRAYSDVNRTNGNIPLSVDMQDPNLTIHPKVKFRAVDLGDDAVVANTEGEYRYVLLWEIDTTSLPSKDFIQWAYVETNVPIGLITGDGNGNEIVVEIDKSQTHEVIAVKKNNPNLPIEERNSDEIYFKHLPTHMIMALEDKDHNYYYIDVIKEIASQLGE